MGAVLYIHGFLSSPGSFKACQVKAWCEQHHPDLDFVCPELTAYPDETIAALKQIVEAHGDDPVYLIGSSLGGYYATYLAERYGLRAVLVNPAVKPYDLMRDHIGVDLKNYYSEATYRLTPADVEQLRALEVEPITRPQNIWLMVQTGDETLDYKLAVEKYRDCEQLVEPGGDHSFQRFDRWLPEIFSFLTGKSRQSTVNSRQ